MKGFIPNDKISEIKNTADLVDVVSEVVLLKKTGKNYLGLCPFHSEKTPSFTVSPEKQIFYCFGCGVGGNVFSFLMKQEGISFPDAARSLARKYGIEIPITHLSSEQKRLITERENLLSINKEAMAFFRQTLLKGGEGKSATEYLRSRRLTQKTIDEFYIGYAPLGWERLAHHFSKKKIPRRLVEKTGLILSKRSGDGYYDRFRNRIVFPIFNLNSQVIGFGGRVLDDALPKYLNSPETPIFNKSRSLYGMNRAKKRCREKNAVFIVEGYFDLLALHQHGIENTVATLGTGLTREHIRLLKGFVSKFYLVYDSDDSGIKAAQRVIEIFRAEEVDARIVVLPADHDPDSYLFKFGSEAFLNIVSKSLGIIPFLIESAVKKHGFSVEGKIRILSDLKRPLSLIKDRIARSLYIQKISERIGVDEEAILEKVRETSSRKIKISNRIFHFDNTGVKKRAHKDIENKLERKIIEMMLQFPDAIAEVKRRNLLKHFENDTLKSIGEMIVGYRGPFNRFVSDMITSMDNEEKKQIVNSLAIGEDLWEKEGCHKLMNQFESIKNRRENTLLQKIKTAEMHDDKEQLLALLKEKQD
ncbi:MAG: DNA primase, partial [Desulfobacterales bacterium]